MIHSVMLKSLAYCCSYLRLGGKEGQYSKKLKYACIGVNVLCNQFDKLATKTIHTNKTILSSEDDKPTNIGSNQSTTTDEPVSSVMKSAKYEVFRDENAPLVLDVVEERRRVTSLEDSIEQEYDEFDGLNLERGVTGVFDIEDLVLLLRREKAVDIFVVSVPASIQYVDYIVVVTSKSLKHMIGMAEFVRRVYKAKRRKTDLIPRLEGETSKDWMAIDLGNIALHIMSNKARSLYDIDSLWSLGKEYDEKLNTSDDDLKELLKKHEINLDDFLPADSNR